jgi:hypothetical protein
MEHEAAPVASVPQVETRFARIALHARFARAASHDMRPTARASGIDTVFFVAGSRARVLRCVYRRRDDVRTYEVVLDEASQQYTIRMWTVASSVTVERFEHMAAALRREHEIEKDLIRQGWTLESYEWREKIGDTDSNPNGARGPRGTKQ